MVETTRIACKLRSEGCSRQGLESGFTLVELLATIGIAAVILAIALPAYGSWRERNATSNAVNSLMAHLKQARILAVAENRSVSITFGAGSYVFDADLSGSCGPCRKQTVAFSQFSSKLTITPTTTRTFSSQGTVNSGTITVASPALSKDVVLNIIGRAYD